MKVNKFDGGFLWRRKADDSKEAGLTLVELLVVIAVVAVLAVTLLPALAETRPNSQAFVCLANQRQLAVAWTMYARDNNDALVVNGVDTNPNDIHPNWVAGSEDYSGSQADTNTAFLTNQQVTLLAPYLNSSRVFKCPTDRSCQFGLRGVPRIRSYSMNIAVGPSGIPGQDPHAKPGRNGNDSWLPWPTYRVFLKESELIAPKPSRLWVITDEEPDSINDGCFAFTMPPNASSTEWIDIPSKAHGGGCDFGFADGHSEVHKWVRPDLISTPTYTTSFSFFSQPHNPDIIWVADHTTSRSDGNPLPY